MSFAQRTAETLISPPAHIIAAQVMGKPIDFEWVEEDIISYTDRNSPALVRLFGPLSMRGQLAVTAGLTEWVTWRLNDLGVFDDAIHFIEAVWASFVDFRYARDASLGWWKGVGEPSLSVRVRAAWILKEQLNDTEILSGGADCICKLAFLAQHVLKGNKHLKAWIKEATSRAMALSPMDEVTKSLFRDEFELDSVDQRPRHYGEPIARAMLDTGLPFEPARNHERIDEFLRNLDPSTNRFLVSPEALLAAGFEGTPYRFPAVQEDPTG